MRFVTAASDNDSIVSCGCSIAVVISALQNKRLRCTSIATLGFALTVVIRSVDVVNAAAAATGGIDLREIREEYCTSERMNIQCNVGTVTSNQVILIRRAVYGRLRPGRCITSEYAHALGCYSDVTTHIDAVCSGHAECSLLVATVDSIAQPCPKDFKSYLEVTFTCITVSYVDDCADPLSNTTHLSNQQGYLALFPRTIPTVLPSMSTLPIVHTCPWLVTVEPGRKINISWQVSSSVLQQSLRHSSNTNSDTSAIGNSLQEPMLQHHAPSTYSHHHYKQQQQVNGCTVTLSISEPGTQISPVKVTCRNYHGNEMAGGSLMTSVYVSKTNRVRIDVMELGLRPFYYYTTTTPPSGHLHDVTDYIQLDSYRKPYIMHYRAFGCATVVPPDGATVQQYGDDVAVVCNQSQDVFYVTCSADDVWVGEIGNCTTRPINKSSYRSSVTSNTQFDTDVKTGIVLVVAIGVVLGVISGGFMLVVIFLIRRRLHQRYTAVKYSNSGNMTARRKQAAPSTTTLTTTSCHPVSCDYDGFLRFHAPTISSTIPSQTACQYCPCPHCRDVTSSNISQPEIDTPDDVIGLDISKPTVDNNFQQTAAHTACCVLEQSVRRPTELHSVAAEQNRHETTYCLPVITSGGLTQTDGELDLTLRAAQMC